MSTSLQSAAAHAVRQALCIAGGEQVLIVTDEPKLDIARALARECKQLDAEVTTYLMIESVRPVLRATRLVEGMLRAADVTFYMLDKRIEEKPFRGFMGKLGQRGRICMMPGVTVDMMERLVDVDFELLRSRTLSVIEAMRDAQAVHVTNAQGTDIQFSVAGRRWIADIGDISRPHTHGCLPAGEAYTCPVEEGMTGTVAFSLIDDCVGPGRLDFSDGALVGYEGEGIERVLRNIGDDLTGRFIGEFGIGTHPHATLCPVMLEAEKALGTCHVAIGDAFGIGRNSSLHHYDALVERPTIIADGRCIMRDGETTL